VDRDQILASLRERILAFAASRIGRDAAEDLAQEVLVVLQEKYAKVVDLTELIPLSFQILRFKLVSSRRKAVRRGEYTQVSVEDVQLPDPVEDAGARLDRMRRAERLAAAVAKLGERCRHLFLLKLEGKSFAEIQVILGAGSINTIYTWDSRCRKQLLELMGGSWETGHEG
jgi:RNA polymerase sigma-70 factor, ECF subfamily